MLLCSTTLCNQEGEFTHPNRSYWSSGDGRCKRRSIAVNNFIDLKIIYLGSLINIVEDQLKLGFKYECLLHSVSSFTFGLFHGSGDGVTTSKYVGFFLLTLGVLMPMTGLVLAMITPERSSSLYGLVTGAPYESSSGVTGAP